MILKTNSFSSIDCWSWSSFCQPWSNLEVFWNNGILMVKSDFGLFVPNKNRFFRCQSFISDCQYSYFLKGRSYNWQDDI